MNCAAILSSLTLLGSTVIFAEDAAEKASEEDAYAQAITTASGHVFAWPFVDWEKMKPRGGTTQGSEVTLVTQPTAAWQALHESGLSKKERDRRAILAIAGSYRVSFDFIETLGFTPDYHPPRPYFSWGTEYVHVLEDQPDTIRLQHALVMYFKDKNGKISGPHVMKHWRQDWTWQDPELFQYAGDRTWKKTNAPSPKGRWSQAVFQVDDSPRYEVMGTWAHEGGLSTWRSDNCPRPLPRREFSVRDDYNVLEGIHEITLSPTGWIHVQHNRKLKLDEESNRTYVGTEIGVNRYEAITAPELAPGFTTHWEKTGPYWQAVRQTWAELSQQRDTVRLHAKVEDQKLWQVHFARAAKIEHGESNLEEDVQHARETVHAFLR